MYPYKENWRELLTEDCEVYIDLDQICYVSASGSEKRSIVAVHKKSKVEKEFPTQTDFWGRGKHAIGGWLGDQNLMRETKGKRPFERDEFILEEKQVADPVEYCYHLLKTKLNEIKNHVSGLETIGVIGGEGNFRLNLPSPSQYKSNREDTLRPLLLPQAREYVVKYHNAIVINGIEADDYLTIKGYEGYLHYQKTGKFNKVICSFDKDQFGTPCLIFNFMRRKGKFLHPDLMLVDDSLGDIWLEKKCIKGWGLKFFTYQMLCGDGTDNIKPYQEFGIRFGDASAFKLIEPCNTEQELYNVIINQYKEWFPNGVEFISWDGTPWKGSAGQWASIIFQMVYMKRSLNDNTTLFSTLKRVGVV